MLLVSGVPGLVHPRVGHVDAHPLPVGGAEGVGGVDPAVGVQHLLGDVPGVNAHDRSPHVLAAGDDECEGEEDDGGDLVVQAEHASIGVESPNFH